MLYQEILTNGSSLQLLQPSMLCEFFPFLTLTQNTNTAAFDSLSAVLEREGESEQPSSYQFLCIQMANSDRASLINTQPDYFLLSTTGYLQATVRALFPPGKLSKEMFPYVISLSTSAIRWGKISQKHIFIKGCQDKTAKGQWPVSSVLGSIGCSKLPSFSSPHVINTLPGSQRNE